MIQILHILKNSLKLTDIDSGSRIKHLLKTYASVRMPEILHYLSDSSLKLYNLYVMILICWHSDYIETSESCIN